MRNTIQIPPEILATAKKLSPYATIPNRPGEGICVSFFFIGDPTLKNDLYYFATVKANDGRFYLVYNVIEDPRDPRNNVVINIALQAPCLYKKWDQNGVILQAASGYQNYLYTPWNSNYLY